MNTKDYLLQYMFNSFRPRFSYINEHLWVEMLKNEQQHRRRYEHYLRKLKKLKKKKPRLTYNYFFRKRNKPNPLKRLKEALKQGHRQFVSTGGGAEWRVESVGISDKKKFTPSIKMRNPETPLPVLEAKYIEYYKNLFPYREIMDTSMPDDSYPFDKNTED